MFCWKCFFSVAGMSLIESDQTRHLSDSIPQDPAQQKSVGLLRVRQVQNVSVRQMCEQLLQLSPAVVPGGSMKRLGSSEIANC